MLSLALITRNAGPDLRRALAAIADGLRPGEDVIALDDGSDDDTLPELAGFMDRRDGALIRLDEPGLPLAEAVALARGKARHPYLLVLDGRDLLLPGALAGLRRVLAGGPQAVVLNRGWTLGGHAAALPAPDAGRLAALGPAPDRAALMTLSPDPGRLLIHAELATRLGAEPCASADPAADLALWHLVLTEADGLALYPETLWLSPLPDRPAAPAIAAAAAYPDCALAWAGDALAFASPEEAPAILEAARNLPDTAAAGLEPGPLGPVLTALGRGETALALAHLALALAAQERRRSTALAGALAGLRRDLDLALPGPEYLRALYERIRAR